MDSETKNIVTDLIKLLRTENAEGIQQLILMCQTMTNSEAIAEGIVQKLEKMDDDEVVVDIELNIGLWLPAIVFYGGESYQQLANRVWPGAGFPQGRFSNRYTPRYDQTI